MATKQKINKKVAGEERVIDVLERFAAAQLYLTTHLGQNQVAKVLGMDNNRASEILKGIKKQQ